MIIIEMSNRSSSKKVESSRFSCKQVTVARNQKESNRMFPQSVSAVLIVTSLALSVVHTSEIPKGQIPDLDTAVAPGAGTARSVEDDEVWCMPEQVHLSLGNVTSEMVVMWATRGNCDSVVHYAAHPWNLDLTASGSCVELENVGNKSLKYLHRAVLKDLSPNLTYYYRPVVKNGVGSNSLLFKTSPSSSSWSSKFLVLSSTGSENDLMNSVTREVQSGQFASLLYNGELGPAERTEDWEGIDESEDFLTRAEQAVATLPVLIAPQSKDEGASGPDVNKHFSMPGWGWPQSVDRPWYSVDVGLVHLVSFSTDLIFAEDTTKATAQRDWLVRDLTEVNQRRNETPWVIALGSHPMYCSYGNPSSDDCAMNTSKVRHALEDMFYHFAVDLVLESGFPGYERGWPQYKGVLVDESYWQPRAPVEIVLGSRAGDGAGAQNKNNTVEWSALHLPEAGGHSFGRLTVANASHLLWELCEESKMAVLDSFWLVQSTHGNFSLANLPHNVSHQINQTIIAMGGKPGTYDFISGDKAGGAGEGWSQYSLWIGLGALSCVLLLVLGLVTLRSCLRRRRAKSGRRWREMDRNGGGAGNFYSVGSDSDTDDNDFEIDVYDKTNKQSSKLLTSY
ncbi:acid phosphatase type 7 [Aplysia californica]|uniref:Acid phosphatase type 7 n=1 Tax=Aplysia californica TaxID=6500 RepID=A0ABM0K3D8_APLCA|nr:acid phosphatase type 7 [Aplysia californica]